MYLYVQIDIGNKSFGTRVVYETYQKTVPCIYQQRCRHSTFPTTN